MFETFQSDYYGLPTGGLITPHLSLEYLAEAGPRLVRLELAGRPGNLLAETPHAGWETPFGRYHMYGGHRLWHAPETRPRTSLPDDHGVNVEPVNGGVRLVGPVENGSGIAKELTLLPDPQRPALTLIHRLRNAGLWAVELAPWAITQLPLGGVAVLPLNTTVSDSLLPNQILVGWPYTRWGDTRLRLRDDWAWVEARPSHQAFKIGAFLTSGWVGYLYQDVFLRKRFTGDPAGAYPDFGCNAEVYTRDQFLELETLGPLVSLRPGETVEHIEKWELVSGFAPPRSTAEIDALLCGPLNAGLPEVPEP